MKLEANTFIPFLVQETKCFDCKIVAVHVLACYMQRSQSSGCFDLLRLEHPTWDWALLARLF